MNRLQERTIHLRLVQNDRAGADRLTDRVLRGEHPVIVEIDDTGIGIPKEQLPKVFDPLFTTQPPGQGTGVGLGLTLAKVIIEQHGGSISLSNRKEGVVSVT